MDQTLLELAATGGPWAWAVLVAGALLWLPNLGLAVTAATGRRVPTASFLLLVLLLVLLAGCGSWVGLLELRHTLASADVGERVRVVGRGLELAWIPLILAARLSPALCSAGALAVALGAWLRAPETRIAAPRHVIAPALLGVLGMLAGAAVDIRIALAAAGATVALLVVSARDDEDAIARRRLAARRSRVAVLGLAGVGLALCAAVASSIARADGILGLEAWPRASFVAFYAPGEVLMRHAVLPAGLAPVGLVGLAGLAATLPLAPRIGGLRTWLGGLATSLVVGLLASVGVVAGSMHAGTWREVLPPRTQVAVPRVEEATPAQIAKRLTWTPRGALVDGTPVRSLAVASARPPVPLVEEGLDPHLLVVIRDAVDQRRDVPSVWPTHQGVPHGWDIEVAAVASADEVAPLFRALIREDPFALAHGVNLVVLGGDGYPTTIPAQLTTTPDEATILVAGPRSWDDIVADVARARREGRVPVLGVR